MIANTMQAINFPFFSFYFFGMRIEKHTTVLCMYDESHGLTLINLLNGLSKTARRKSKEWQSL
jgi:hypothetical protein